MSVNIQIWDSQVHSWECYMKSIEQAPSFKNLYLYQASFANMMKIQFK